MNLLMTLAQTGSAVDTADDSNLLFCDGGIFLIIICVIFAIFLFTKADETTGSIAILGSFIFYVMCDIGEFEEGHIVHGILGAALVIIPIALAAIAYALDERVRKKEIPQIPERVDKFISAHGYASPQAFIKYSDEAPEFQHARKVQYTNPLYTKQVSENEKRRENKQKPLKITEPSEISYGKFAGFKYKEVVLTHFMTELPDVLKNIYMFDHADIFAHMPDYSRFFMNLSDSDTRPSAAKTTYRDYFEDISVPGAPEQTEDDNTKYELLLYDYKTVDEIYFKQSCVGVINKLIADNIIERVGNNDIFRSKVIPEDEGNIVEGETLEISFDD